MLVSYGRREMTDGSRCGEGYFQIGEAAERTQLTQRTLRYYEEKGLLRPPTRMDGGFRLYSQDDIERLERVKQLKDLLGFSLAEVKEMLEADDVRTAIRAGWRKDADAADKAGKIRLAREVTVRQLALLDQKMAKMAALHEHLTERIEKYDTWLRQWSEEDLPAAAAPGQ